ncbi:MAG: DUF4328 domain-containing protein [Pyrinomonadaceae bacterium]
MNDVYRSTKTWSLITIAGLAFISIFELFAILIGIGQLVNPDAVVNLDEDGLTSVWLMIQGILALLQFPVYVATIVAFLVWLNRSYKNLHSLRPSHLEFSSGWAVGYWFIPVLMLWKPFQIVREVWWESDPVIPEDQLFLTASLHNAPTYMGFWWAFWLISNVANNIASRMFDLEGTRYVAVAGIAFIAAAILTIVAAALAIAVVRDITRRQAARFLSVRDLEAQAFQRAGVEPNWR